LRKKFDYEEAHVQTFPMKFACPSVVLRDGATNSGATESAQPWGDAVAEAEGDKRRSGPYPDIAVDRTSSSSPVSN
jgi:hypothetical protein